MVLVLIVAVTCSTITTSCRRGKGIDLIVGDGKVIIPEKCQVSSVGSVVGMRKIRVGIHVCIAVAGDEQIGSSTKNGTATKGESRHGNQYEFLNIM